jgi:Fe-S cluster biogenesis protein NfuA
MDESTIAPALDEIRGLVRADGGDMTLVEVDGPTIKLQLVVEGAHCVECVMPRELLEQISLDIFRRGGVAAEAVSIDDPREHPEFVMPDQ